MAKKKVHKKRKSISLKAATAVIRKHKKGKSKKSSGHLSEMNLPLIGKVDFKPILAGGLGGAVMVLYDKVIPMIPIKFLQNGIVAKLVPFALSFAAMKMKQKEAAAGIAGVAVYKATRSFMGLEDNGDFQNHQYADPSLLQDGDNVFYDQESGQYIALSDDEMLSLAEAGLLSEENLLSESIYPNYSPLYEDNEE